MGATLAATAIAALALASGIGRARAAADPEPARCRGMTIGYNEYRTDLPNGDACDQSTRACVVEADGTRRRELAHGLKRDDYTAVSFAGWSSDGGCARLTTLRTTPEETKWETERQTYRPGMQRQYASYLFDMSSGRSRPEPPPPVPSSPLTSGVHGYKLSPDGRRMCAANGRLAIANADGSDLRYVDTGFPFNFIPQFSPDGRWIAVLSGVHPIADLFVVGSDGAGLRKVGARNGYEGFTVRWDVYHFHNGDSDVHTWSPDGRWLYYTARFGEAVDLMRASVDGAVERLTHSDESVVFQHPVVRPGGGTRTGIRNSHPAVSPDGKWLAFTSTRSGRRQIYVMPSGGGEAYPITNVGPGWGARHPQWRPVSGPASRPAP